MREVEVWIDAHARFRTFERNPCHCCPTLVIREYTTMLRKRPIKDCFYADPKSHKRDLRKLGYQYLGSL